VLSATFVLPSDVVAAHDGIARVGVALALLAHVVAAAVWLGGAIVIAAAGLPMRDLNGLGSVVRSFSQITLVTVVTIVVSSAVIVVAGAKDVGALLTSGYGAWLLVKVAAFAAMVVVADHGRRNLDIIVLHRLRTGTDSLSGVQAWSLLMGAQLVSGAVLILATVGLVVAGPPG
jgi:putative copper export protein